MKPNNDIKNFLKEYTWGREGSGYYEIQQVSESLFEHPGYSMLLDYSKGVGKILDVGCGEGSKTNQIYLKSGAIAAYGVDISPFAIATAKKRYPKIHFIEADVETLPFEDGFFDLVYTGFVLEHTQNPEKVVREIIRVTRVGGFGVILCPNYGSPNRCSPPFKGNRIKKLLLGVLNDINFFSTDLNWGSVTPLSDGKNLHVMDYDTTVEPYIRTLRNFLKHNGVKIVECTSLWSLENGNSFYHRFFSFLGKKNLYPFNYWGPQVMLLFKK